MIKLDNINFKYNTIESNSGINNVSLNIRQGECVVLCGASGCGKTTLLRLMSGLAPGQYEGTLEGNIIIGGKAPAEMTCEDKAHTIGMVFQDPRSQFFMSNVREELAFTGENIGIDCNTLLELVSSKAELIGISALLDQTLNHLSSGQKQKVAIAASCLLNPPILFLDEPTANLDAQSTGAFIDILRKLKNSETTIVISEHRLNDFLLVADRYICLEEGHIVREWTEQEFEHISVDEAKRYRLRHPGLVEQFARLSCANGKSDFTYRIEKLSFCYKKSENGFKDINAQINGGTVTAIVGENGAGKTTLCKVLCGLMRAKSGAVYKNGKAMNKSKLRQSSYFVMQDADYQMFTESVGNELVLGRKITAELKERAYAAMREFGLIELKDRHPASLSGGEKQRVTLAAACCSDADLIVLDEPTSGLDAENAKRVANYVLNLCKLGKAVVIITHDPLLIALAGNNQIKLT